ATFADSELGPIPEGWEVATVDSLSEVVDCLHTKKPEQMLGGERLLLQLNNIRDDGLIDTTMQYTISEADYAVWAAKFETRKGDCVITNVGRVGVAAQVPDGVTAAIGRNMTAMRLLPDHPWPAYFIQSLVSDALRTEIQRNTDNGTIMNALNVRNIGKLRM